jgi:hypothetical protein
VSTGIKLLQASVNDILPMIESHIGVGLMTITPRVPHPGASKISPARRFWRSASSCYSLEVVLQFPPRTIIAGTKLSTFDTSAHLILTHLHSIPI